MKILVFAFACDPTKGSEPNFGFNLAAGLVDAGHQVWVITQSKGKAGIEAEQARNPRANLHFLYLDLSPRWHRWYNNQLGMYAFYLQWQYKAGKLGKSLDKKESFDLCHHITWGSFQLGTGAALVGKPIVYGPCGGGQFALPMFKEYFLQGWRSEVLRKYVSNFLVTANPLLKKTLAHKQCCVVASNQDTFDMARRLKAKKVVLFSDPALPQEAWKPEVRIRHKTNAPLQLIWTGRLAPRKGLKFTLWALSLVNKRVPFHLTIVGDGQQGKDVPTWIRAFGLEDRVTWRGAVPWAQVLEAYAAADLFVFTTLRDSVAAQYLEAMAEGLPVVTLNMNGAVTFVPDEAGYKIPVSNPPQMAAEVARAIEDFYDHPEKWQGMSHAAREQAFAYLWPQKIAYYEELYHNLLAAGPKRAHELVSA